MYLQEFSGCSELFRINLWANDKSSYDYNETRHVSNGNRWNEEQVTAGSQFLQYTLFKLKIYSGNSGERKIG